MRQELDDLFTDGQFKLMDEEFDEAIEIFTRVLEEDHNHGKVYQARAVAYLRKGEKDLAMADIDRAIECNPENPRFHYHKGAILMQQELLDEAIECLSRAIDLDPSYAAPYLLRGQIYEKLGDEESASSDISMAMALRKEQTKASKIVDF